MKKLKYEELNITRRGKFRAEVVCSKKALVIFLQFIKKVENIN